MKIAVTSASGQLGSAIVRHLKHEIGDDHVIAIARTPENAKHLGVEVRKGDYNSPADLQAALKGVNKVLLISGNDQPQKRIQQHRNVIEAAKLNDVRKIVYTSIIGDENKAAFSPIVQSNRQTEKDVQESGLDWVIGRNGIYIEPDIEYLDHYIKDGEIRNSAGEGKCAYTCRAELGFAYMKMLLGEKHNRRVYDLAGEPITQTELVVLLNQVYQTQLVYNPVTIEAYESERKKALGEFIGTVIAGIYEGIARGFYDLKSDFEKVTGRPHQSALEMIKTFRDSQKG